MPKFPKAVMDTCALLDALLLHYYFSFSKQDFIAQYAEKIIPNKTLMRKVSKFYNSIENYETTSHCIGELQGLFNSRVKPFTEKENSKNEIKSNFWEISIKYLKSKKLNESFIKLIDLSSNCSNFKLIQNVGYIDAGIIHLASQNWMPIITKDNRTLKASVKHKEIQVIIPEEYAHAYIR